MAHCVQYLNENELQQNQYEEIKMKNENVTLPLFDIHQAAYLALNGIQANLTRQGTRVVFEFPGTRSVFALLQQYNSNPPVRILDYVSHLRRLRSQMLIQKE